MDKYRGGAWLMKVISIVLAVFLWIYVTNELNPTKEQVLRQVPIEARGLVQALAIREMPHDVNLRVQGNQNVVVDLTGKSVEVWVDLSKVREGENKLPVQVKLPTGVRLVEVRPAEVAVQIDRLAEKHAHVKVAVVSQPVGGYRYLTPVAKPSQVIVKGPAKVLAGIDVVQVKVDLTDRSSNVLETIPLQAVNEQGMIIDKPGLHIVPGQAEVFVPVVEDLPQKIVPVKVPVAGAPAAGWVVTAVIPLTETVTVTGMQEVLAGIGEVRTDEVDVTGVKEDLVKTVRLVLPAGVTSPVTPEVRVLVKIGRG